MTLKLRPVAYCTRSSAHFYANTVARASGVRMRVHMDEQHVFWIAEPTGLFTGFSA